MISFIVIATLYCNNAVLPHDCSDNKKNVYYSQDSIIKYEDFDYTFCSKKTSLTTFQGCEKTTRKGCVYTVKYLESSQMNVYTMKKCKAL